MKNIKLSKQQAKRKQKQPPVFKETVIHCPYCNKLIDIKLKVCIYCHGKILTPMEKLMEKVFNKRNIIILSVVILLVAMVIVLKMYPQYK